MSLSAHEEQVLNSVEDGLARSDPRLASLLATFTRLTSGEEMPAAEKILAACRRDTRRSRRRSYRDRACRPARQLYRLLGSRQAALLWLVAVAAVVLVAVALAAGRHSGGRGACLTSRAAACTTPASAHVSGPAVNLYRATI